MRSLRTANSLTSRNISSAPPARTLIFTIIESPPRQVKEAPFPPSRFCTLFAINPL
jgi:hypothetical protein